MYCDKDNVNILTSLLVAHGVRHAVVCPGSRNAPIVHNLDNCETIACHPVTDERSAGFYALGICQATDEPVAVCVTSGTALLNLAPAVAEAMYQHQPLIAISADRPRQWIGQLTGQTMPQAGVLAAIVKQSADLPEPHDSEERWHCNRLVNEALIAALQGSRGPVHINIPISEPLYSFSTESLPEERVIKLSSAVSEGGAAELLSALERARRPIIIMGQMKPGDMPDGVIQRLRGQHYVIMHEVLSGNEGSSAMEETIALAEMDGCLPPDIIVFVGDTLVSKRARRFLSHARTAEAWTINAEGIVHDPFMNLRGVIQARPSDVLTAISGDGPREWSDYWERLRTAATAHRETFSPVYSNLLAVRLLHECLSGQSGNYVMHYANSTPIRLGCLYARSHVFCNRGINGIEGSLSTAAGYSLSTAGTVYCVIGDLSFFYDQNALWNTNIRGNLRILLLNNSGGEIFAKFDGLRQSNARGIVMGSHNTSAEGICIENNITYLKAHNTEELCRNIKLLTTVRAERPILLEVFTDTDEDMRAYKEYFNTL